MSRIAKVIRNFSLGFLLFVVWIANVQAQSANAQQIKHYIDNLLVDARKKGDISIAIQSMKTGEIVYKHNADAALIPASNQKIFTAYVALQQLGPAFSYKTQLLTDAKKINNGVLDGNLYMRFDGDPELDLKDLNQLIFSLSQQGVHSITGNVYIDGNRFDSNEIAPGTLPSDIRYCYGAPIGAAIINRNCTNLKVIPAHKPGHVAQIAPITGIPLLVYSKVITKAVTKGCRLKLTETADGKYELNGCVKVKSKPVGLSFAVKDTRIYSEEIIRSLLLQYQIKVMNTKGQPQANAMLRVLGSHDSRSLKDLVYEMMKKSDNIIANALFKTIGANYFNRPGSWENSSQAVQAILAKQNISIPVGAQIVDGSGLSCENRASAAEILQILRKVYQNTELNADFIPALPIAGIDGTLKRRLREKHIIGKVRAKTGTMGKQGVSSLSGYVEGANQDVYAFSIIVNRPGVWMGKYRILEDKICQFLSRL